MIYPQAPTCGRCHHIKPCHEHWRPGRDCALCECPSYRRPRGFWVMVTVTGVVITLTAMILLSMVTAPGAWPATPPTW